jgi:hypothetical protein
VDRHSHRPDRRLGAGLVADPSTGTYSQVDGLRLYYEVRGPAGGARPGESVPSGSATELRTAQSRDYLEHTTRPVSVLLR